MLNLRALDSLGGGDFGWLKAKHHFAVDGNYSDSNRPIGSLVVLNDDEIAPKSGFPMHGHRDMEIVTYVREGRLVHEDNTGARGEISAGNVQAFSAGAGIRHSEHNAGDGPLRLFQIWLLPRNKGIAPRWATKLFPKTERSGQLVVLASGFDADLDAVPIDAEARVLGATLESGQTLNVHFDVGEQGYLVIAHGSVTVNGLRLSERDGLAISDEPELEITTGDSAELVLIITSVVHPSSINF